MHYELEWSKCFYNLRPHGFLHIHDVPFLSTYLFGNVRCVCFLWLVHLRQSILEIEGESSFMLTSSLPSFMHYITICYPCIIFSPLHSSLSCPNHQTCVHYNYQFCFIDTKHHIQSSSPSIVFFFPQWSLFACVPLYHHVHISSFSHLHLVNMNGCKFLVGQA